MSELEWATEGVLGRRFLGWIFDGVILAVVGTVAWTLCLAFGVLTLGLGWGLFGLLPLLPLIYSVAFLSSGLAATPGHAMMGLMVVRDDDGGRPDLARALVLSLGYYLTLATSGLLLLVAVFTDGHRALHDMVAGVTMARRDRVRPAALAGFGHAGAAWRR